MYTARDSRSGAAEYHRDGHDRRSRPDVAARLARPIAVGHARLPERVQAAANDRPLRRWRWRSVRLSWPNGAGGRHPL